MGIIKGPGKFEGELHLTTVLYEISMNGFGGESCGSAAHAGAAELFTNVSLDDCLSWAEDTGVSAADIKEDFKDTKGKNGKVHAILFYRTDGFVEGEYYPSAKRAEKEFGRLCEELEPEGEDYY